MYVEALRIDPERARKLFHLRPGAYMESGHPKHVTKTERNNLSSFAYWPVRIRRLKIAIEGVRTSQTCEIGIDLSSFVDQSCQSTVEKILWCLAQ